MHLISQDALAFAERRLGKKAGEKTTWPVPMVMKKAEGMLQTQMTKLIKPILKFENKWVHIHYTFNQKMNLMYQEAELSSEAQNWLRGGSLIGRSFYKDIQPLSNYQYINLVNPVSLKYKKYLGRNLLRERLFPALYLTALIKRPVEKQLFKSRIQPIKWFQPSIEYVQQPALKLHYHSQISARSHPSLQQPEVSTDIESKNVVRQVKQAFGAQATGKEYMKKSKAKNEYERADMSENALAELTNQIYGRLEKRLRMEQLRRGV